MKIKLTNNKLEDIKNSYEIVILKDLNNLEEKEKNLLDDISFIVKSFNTYFNSLNKKLYVSCLEFTKKDIKIAFFKAINFLKKTEIKSVKIDIFQNNKELNIQNIVEGLVLGNYSFEKYKSTQNNKNIEVLISIYDSKKSIEKLQKILHRSLIISNSVNFTRDIVNTTPQDYTPLDMSKTAMSFVNNKNISCKVYGENEILQEKMNAMFSVGKASVNESQLIHLTYKPKNPKAKIVLVGKGVTYDTGGLSLKRGDSMVSMKCDKAGASTILGIFEALGKLDIPFEIHGIIGAVENMIGGNAYKPDDILKAKNGKTIEVTNTDAEGRLVLADCLCFAQEKIENIDYIFDFATLTGASIMAFGGYTTAVMGYSEKVKKQIAKASKKSGELVGFLPFNEFLEKRLKSEVADMINTSPNKNGGAITAALFLSKFIEEKNKKKWLHFDIAGPSYRQEEWGINPYGATGVGVRLMFEFFGKLEK